MGGWWVGGWLKPFWLKPIASSLLRVACPYLFRLVSRHGVEAMGLCALRLTAVAAMAVFGLHDVAVVSGRSGASSVCSPSAPTAVWRSSTTACRTSCSSRSCFSSLPWSSVGRPVALVIEARTGFEGLELFFFAEFVFACRGWTCLLPRCLCLLPVVERVDLFVLGGLPGGVVRALRG